MYIDKPSSGYIYISTHIFYIYLSLSLLPRYIGLLFNICNLHTDFQAFCRFTILSVVIVIKCGSEFIVSLKMFAE